jgi:hypothetical protein
MFGATWVMVFSADGAMVQISGAPSIICLTVKQGDEFAMSKKGIVNVQGTEIAVLIHLQDDYISAISV